ncbi:unnamed protein product [Allacma fusca]|uniref:DUF4806 domain-containing protein n=1 Tax=Allacma fusca TaxID=39272 RepID=A0A8J2L9R7_9HEXA|nr:unnamed protein product [Allacma fusca]
MDPEPTWKQWKIRILDTFESYKEARKGLQKSVFTSDLGATDHESIDKNSEILRGDDNIVKRMRLMGSSETTLAVMQTVNRESQSCEDVPANISLAETSPALPNAVQYLKHLDRKVESIGARVKQIALQMEAALEKLNSLQESDDNSDDLDLPLPLRTSEDVEEFETKIKDSPSVKKQFSDLVRRMGGSSLMNVTRRVVLLVFSRELVVQYSWAGRTKKSFKSLLLSEIIIEKISRRCNTERNQVELAIADVLKSTKPSKNVGAAQSDA